MPFLQNYEKINKGNKEFMILKCVDKRDLTDSFIRLVLIPIFSKVIQKGVEDIGNDLSILALDR